MYKQDRSLAAKTNQSVQDPAASATDKARLGVQRRRSVPLVGFTLLGVIALSSGSTALAQQIPIVQSGADGRYERHIDPMTSIPGFDPATSKAFRAAVHDLVAQLDAMPAVTAPPQPVCHRLMTYIEITPPHGVPAGSVSVMSPINFNGGRCSPLTGGGIELILNRTSAAFERSRATIADAEGGRANWFALDAKFSDNLIRLPDGTTLITSGNALLTPVSARRFATEQVKRKSEDERLYPPQRTPTWVAQLDRLSAEAGSRQACLGDWGEIDTTQSCPAARRIWEVNPAYFDKARSGAIQLIVLRTPQGPYHGESPERFKARQAVWASLDIGRLTALVTR